jgi:hypothetical protein
MEEDFQDIPFWFARHTLSLKRSGTLSLIGERQINLSLLSNPKIVFFVQFVKVLDLTNTPIGSLSGLTRLPHLTAIILDRSELADLKNISAVSSVTSFSAKGTPISRTPHYRLSVFLGLGPNIVRIDGQLASPFLKKRAAAFPRYAHSLVNKGWIAEWPLPSQQKFEELSNLYEVEFQLAEGAEKEDDSVEFDDVIDGEFEQVVQKLWREHENLIQRKLAIFGILQESEQKGDVSESGDATELMCVDEET